MRKRLIHSLAIVFLATTGVFAQGKEQEKDSIDTQTVHVVTAYNPSVSDAFKIKGSPSLDDSVTTSKKNIEYTIFSVPVASTFTPAKGKASGVEKAPAEKLYNSYASLGLGNYTTVLADFYTSRALSRNETLDIGLRHHSSQGGIEGVDLDNKFFNTKVDAAYFKRDKDMTWGADMDIQHQIYNWYGIPQELFTDTEISAIDPKQSYLNLELGGHVTVNEGYFKGGTILLRNFSDGFSSSENRAIVKPSFQIPIKDQLITTHVFLDYVGGKFDKDITGAASINYGSLQMGVNPNVTILKDDLSLNLGATLAYGMDMENNENKFYVYPNVTASYRVLEGFVTAYAGAEGKLVQNSYHDFVDENPFVSPTLYIMPSSQQYDIYAGIKGKFLPTVGYNLKAGYKSTDDYAFYTSNGNTNVLGFGEEGYQYANSFNVIYDKLNALTVEGELNITPSNNFSIGATAQFSSYSTETIAEAYNIPSVKGSVFSDFKIGKKWYGGASVFFVGERKDLVSLNPLLTPAEVVTLDSYFDANFNLGYHITDRLSAFLKLNNIANNDYQRWLNYKVQGFQAIIGATYKFDF